jgi:hypothetical protein
LFSCGHSGVEGNEEADKLANKDSESAFIKHSTFQRHSNGHYKKMLKSWLKLQAELHCSKRQNTDKQNFSYHYTHKSELLKLGRKQIRCFFTEHGKSQDNQKVPDTTLQIL